MYAGALSILAFAAAAVAAPLESRATCSGAYTLWARGSYEYYNNSTLISLVNIITYATGGSSSSIVYPATIIGSSDTPAYQQSVAIGINNTILQIQQYVQACGSQSQIVLVGYSQGGQVMTDTLAGGANEPGPIDTKYLQYIKATVVFGDPTFTYPSQYAAGNATTSGIYQRFSNDPSENTLNFLSSRLRSYCTAFDPVCSGGQNLNYGAHAAEVRDHQSDAQAFVLGIFGK